jgi:hypothetical protein
LIYPLNLGGEHLLMRVINFGEFMAGVKFSYVLYDKSIFTDDPE